MAIYELQKMIRDVNRTPDLRALYFSEPDRVVARYDLSDEERAALAAGDFGALYRLGVHGLLLRPFSILHQVSERDYLAAIRQGH